MILYLHLNDNRVFRAAAIHLLIDLSLFILIGDESFQWTSHRNAQISFSLSNVDRLVLYLIKLRIFWSDETKQFKTSCRLWVLCISPGCCQRTMEARAYLWGYDNKSCSQPTRRMFRRMFPPVTSRGHRRMNGGWDERENFTSAGERASVTL